MKIKQRIITLSVLALMSAGLCTAAFVAPRQSAAPVQQLSQEADAEYYLRDCDGYIAVYRGGASAPLDVTDIETATLNETDIKLLSSGIPAHSRNELLMLLEDLGS